MKKIFLLAVLGIWINVKAEIKALPEDSIYQVKSKWIDQDKKEFELSQFRGKPVAISMIYLTCKFSCPLTVAHMKELEKALPPELKDKIQFILVSFDPKRDTPERMKAFAKKNGLVAPKWRMITSKNEQDIRELSALIDFKYKKTDEEFEHSFGIVALNSDGKILGSTIGSEMKEKDLVPLFQKSF